MKKLLIVMLVALLLVSFASCKKKEDTEDTRKTKKTTVTTESSKTKSTESKDSEDDGFSYYIAAENLGGVLDVNLPVFDGADEALNDYFTTLKTSIATNKDNLDYFQMTAEEMYYETCYIGFKIVTDKMYTGAAHDTFQINSVTFNYKTGEILKLSEIFKDKYTDRIVEYVNDRLDEVDGAFVDDVSEIFNENNFYLGEDSFTVFFNDYDIAPYASRPQYFEIPYSEMSDYLQEDFEFLID